MVIASEAWPRLTLSEWEGTLATFHMWTQIVGKVRLALEPMLNHWWQVPLYISARGLTTSLMHSGATGVEIEFDIVEQVLEVRTTDGRRGRVEPQTVAHFYQATMTTLEEVGIRVKILPRPQEVVDAIPFPQDEQHRSYDGAAIHQFWLALVQAHRVMVRSGPVSSVRPAPCTTSGAQAISPSPAFRAGRHPSTPAACPTAPTGRRNWPTATK
jgi:hypothetical protein